MIAGESAGSRRARGGRRGQAVCSQGWDLVSHKPSQGGWKRRFISDEGRGIKEENNGNKTRATKITAQPENCSGKGCHRDPWMMCKPQTPKENTQCVYDDPTNLSRAMSKATSTYSVTPRSNIQLNVKLRRSTRSAGRAEEQRRTYRGEQDPGATFQEQHKLISRVRCLKLCRHLQPWPPDSGRKSH